MPPTTIVVMTAASKNPSSFGSTLWVSFRPGARA